MERQISVEEGVRREEPISPDTENILNPVSVYATVLREIWKTVVN